jgi:RNA polymerase sigma factor (TIGR02999 family)
MAEPGDVTRLLDVANNGDSDALRSALTLVYGRLRERAHWQLKGEAAGHTLETDGLVNEAFLRLLGAERVQWRDRQHLLAMSARMMRRVLIDYADRRHAAKRGGDSTMVPFDDAIVHVDQHVDEIRALGEALQRLEAINPRYSQVVECRFFAGLSVEETADALEISPATVKRDWQAARAWLNRELAT